MLAGLAQKVGMQPEQVTTMLAQFLPHAIDHATPGGEVPEAGAAMPDLSGLMGRLLGR
jgi:uncharacterized protein YidB (DUF937 family)